MLYLVSENSFRKEVRYLPLLSTRDISLPRVTLRQVLALAAPTVGAKDLHGDATLGLPTQFLTRSLLPLSRNANLEKIHELVFSEDNKCIVLTKNKYNKEKARASRTHLVGEASSCKNNYCIIN